MRGKGRNIAALPDAAIMGNKIGIIADINSFGMSRSKNGNITTGSEIKYLKSGLATRPAAPFRAK
jgi:hypothetical protein